MNSVTVQKIVKWKYGTSLGRTVELPEVESTGGQNSANDGKRV